jgi:hypothetical protein
MTERCAVQSAQQSREEPSDITAIDTLARPSNA